MDTSTQFQTQSIGALPAITHYLAQYQGSCHRVPFGLDCWDFPENSAWRPAASRAKPLILQGLAPRTFPKRAELGKVLGSPLRRSPRQKCQSARGLHPDGTSSQLLWGWARYGGDISIYPPGIGTGASLANDPVRRPEVYDLLGPS
jgi:hypothetical protein